MANEQELLAKMRREKDPGKQAEYALEYSELREKNNRINDANQLVSSSFHDIQVLER